MDNFLTLFDLIGELARRRYQAAERGFAVLGINHTEARLLTLLDQEGGTATQDALSNRIFVDRSNAGRALKHLEQAGHIERHTGDTDKRTNLVHMTAKGESTVAEISRLREAMAQRFFGELTEDEAGSVVELLKAVANATMPKRSEPIPSGDRAQSGNLTLATLSLAMLLSSLGTSIANVALPTLTQAFSVSFQAAQWIVLAYLLATTTLIVSVGRLGDIVGRRRLLLTGLALFTVASVLCGVAPALWLLIAARSVQGLGAAIMMALALAFVGETVPKEKTGSAMGLLGTTSALGTALGPSLGGVLIAGLGWRAIFFVNVPLAVVALVLAYRHLPADRLRPAADRPRFDTLGTVLLALMLGAYALAMTIGRVSFGLLNIALMVVAISGLALFAFAEARAASPLIRLSMVRDPVLSAGLAMSALVSTVMMATLVVGPFYLSNALGLGAALVGAVMSVGPLVVALTGVPAGRIVDRLGAGRMTILGLIAMATGSVMLSLIPATFGVLGYIAPIVLITLGYGSFQTANNTAVMKDVRQDQRGIISGMLNLSRNLGLVTGASVMGAVFALAAGTSDIATALPEDVATGMRTTFAVAATLIVVALLVAVKSQPYATLANTTVAAPQPLSGQPG